MIKFQQADICHGYNGSKAYPDNQLSYYMPMKYISQHSKGQKTYKETSIPSVAASATAKKSWLLTAVIIYTESLYLVVLNIS